MSEKTRLHRYSAGRYGNGTVTVEKTASGWRWQSAQDLSVGGEWRATKSEAMRDLDAYCSPEATAARSVERVAARQQLQARPERLITSWPLVDAIEIATVGVDVEEPVATGNENVTRIDGEDASGYRIVAHSVYVHRSGVGATCLCDCWDRDAAQQLGRALALMLGVPVDDYTADVEVAR